MRGLPTCYLVAETLIRLKECLQPFSANPHSTAVPLDLFVRLPLQAFRHCRDLADFTRSALVKQFALSSACRSELMQVSELHLLEEPHVTIYD
jgi:hypothetical protein